MESRRVFWTVAHLKLHRLRLSIITNHFFHWQQKEALRTHKTHILSTFVFFWNKYSIIYIYIYIYIHIHIWSFLFFSKKKLPRKTHKNHRLKKVIWCWSQPSKVEDCWLVILTWERRVRPQNPQKCWQVQSRSIEGKTEPPRFVCLNSLWNLNVLQRQQKMIVSCDFK